MFKHHRYPKAIILQAVYFKLRFTMSYRDVEELLSIRGVQVDHSTIQRWVYKFTPMIEANMHRRKRQVCTSWRMDETYSVPGSQQYNVLLWHELIWNMYWVTSMPGCAGIWALATVTHRVLMRWWNSLTKGSEANSLSQDASRDWVLEGWRTWTD